MLPLVERPLSVKSLNFLERLQSLVDGLPEFPARVADAKSRWNNKARSTAGKEAFAEIRATLAAMCTGPVRCHYCEDSAADEIEHIRPKSLFPELCFVWGNYLFSCGPCNGPKGNLYSFVRGGVVKRHDARKGAVPVPPPGDPDALINPRAEDPRKFMEIDLGGVAPDGSLIEGTFHYLPLDGLFPIETARVEHTIEVLGLNREVLLAARRNAFSGYRARLKEYGDSVRVEAPPGELETMKRAILETPHLSVLAEMVRQADVLPFMEEILVVDPAILTWLSLPRP